MKVLVTGGSGQLGTDVTDLLCLHGYDVYSYGRDQLDITDNNQVQRIIREICPDVIVHTAAYTKVDLAETEIDQAYQVNALGTRNVAVAAEAVQAKVVYISTDYVFDGKADTPYHEFSSVNPLGIYGKTKLAGEQMVQYLCSRWFIVRTSWVYGSNGHNFVKTMLRLGKERNELNVVHDQIGTPTYTKDLAVFLENLIHTELYGVYHASNIGSCSWYEFAREIFAIAGMEVIVNPITTAQYPLPAPRPAYSLFDHMAIRLNGLGELPPWQKSLKVFIHDFLRD